jgi:hypothetical protein
VGRIEPALKLTQERIPSTQSNDTTCVPLPDPGGPRKIKFNSEMPMIPLRWKTKNVDASGSQVTKGRSLLEKGTD